MSPTAPDGRLVRKSVDVGADEDVVPLSDGSAATSHICEHIQCLPQIRQEVPLFVKRTPHDSEAPSAGAIRTSLGSLTSIPHIFLLKQQDVTRTFCRDFCRACLR